MTLRERKKALTRSAIEDAALRLFQERGYDATTLEDVCESVLVSRRTFFRYFGHKEDVLLARFRDALTEAGTHLRDRPAGEGLRASLAAQFDRAAEIYDAAPERELIRIRLLSTTPSLAGGYLRVLTGFESMVRAFAAERTGEPADGPGVRLIAAGAMTAFRVALEVWADGGGTEPLGPLAQRNLERLLGDVR
ncbi:TetR family transcriptional regulator [Allonocardiopsis opalescens]|uniref:TetR family transcriptional regulator n=1 Tax=Allonocardiopsis opalescens TaxID=1144618 RepID=A0A2T0Q5I9_9ACTN|nr:TetR family transcriptional regulator [Allonocardiopsis opalescens]PRX99085.1 TetR family transcriptional regulator [Allonocardiopsis opalescens]